jgi:hypothetical protein
MNTIKIHKLEESFKKHLIVFYDLELDNIGPVRTEFHSVKKKMEDFVRKH